jgi:hypothetical protein
MDIKSKPVVNRNRISNHYFSKDIDWPEGSPDEIISYMKSLKDIYSDIVDLYVDSYYRGHEDNAYRVSGFKYETDKEYEIRVHNEEVALKCWEEKYIKWIETKGKEKAAKEQAKLDEQLRQYNLLKEKLEKAGKLP